MRHADALEFRPYERADHDAVMSLLQASLQWPATDQYRAYFDWKHVDNAFGPSPAWVAVDGARVAGLRVFLRWEFESPDGVVRAVRAVDTATHPDYQGRGIFTRLTMTALDGLKADGVDFVFNTPNDKSGGGYLKMGWRELGRVPLRFRPRGVASAVRTARARTTADRWGAPCAAGASAGDALGDEAAVGRLLASLPRSARLHTRRSVDYLRWRYAGLPELGYRALVDERGVDHGVVFFRVRRRGDAMEAGINDVLVPGGEPAVARRLQARVLAESRADYLLRVALDPTSAPLTLPLPGQGPALFWRSVVSDTQPDLAAWELTLGDVEMF
jgi:GNAT superfamily N-acetyltransferase